MTKKVKNVSDKMQNIVNVGQVEAGGVVTVPDDFNNVNFVEESKTEKSGSKSKKDEVEKPEKDEEKSNDSITNK